MYSLAERIAQANSILHPSAVPHEGRHGRAIEEMPDETRSTFQRDRDRILQSTAFRRLQGKTQVFVAGEGDHFRTRLTHTMEVAQISRDIARALGLNEDLAECIGLAHDLGHPPFGHRGEEAINTWMLGKGKHFEHNEQSYRIVTLLEKRTNRYEGLNLNREVEDGLLKHSDIGPNGRPLERTLEADVANIADEIAYTSHDCDDGIMAELFPFDELIKIPLAKEAYERSRAQGSHLRGSLVHVLVKDLLKTSQPLLGESPDQPRIMFSPAIRATLMELRRFLAGRMYTHPRVRDRAVEGQAIITLLCNHYFANPTDKIIAIQKRTASTLEEAVKDYVAGMTDNFAWMQAAEHGLLPLNQQEELIIDG